MAWSLSGAPKSWPKIDLRFWRNFQTVFHTSYMFLSAYQQCMSVQFLYILISIWCRHHICLCLSFWYYYYVASVVSDSVRPHRQQLTRLRHPWDSPGKNTGVDCHFLLQCMKVKSESEVAQSCPTLRNPMDCSLPGSPYHGIFQARVLEWGAIAFSISFW